MDDFLEQALTLLLSSVSWLKLLPQGGIFLSEDAGEKAVLRLVASRDFDPEISMACRRVPYGHCLCGQAASRHQIQFCASLDGRHETRFPGMKPHGHYCVPLISNEKTLGVLVLYLPEGHVCAEHEEAFLSRIVDVLSAGVIRRRAESEIEYQAFHDALTGLPNRRLLSDRLRHDLAVNRRRGTFGALLSLDLDHFKKLNDALGHTVGDALLDQVGKRLLEHVRTEDTVARMGGDEFVVLLSQLSAEEEQASYEAHVVAEKLRDNISQPCYIEGREHQITTSIGIVLFPTNGETPEELLRFADNAMFRAKDAGRNAIRYFMPGMQHAADRRLKLENDLRHAIDRKELDLYLQPQVDSTGRIIGAECLLRWFHSMQGQISPADFIPIAEESNIILSLGEWALREACKLLNTWENDGCMKDIQQLAINVSPRQFHQQEFIHQLTTILEETGANPQHLELELTEGMLLENINETVDKMKALRNLGIRFSIDDFGTGYSSLFYLKRLPLNKLKIDQSFVCDLVENANDAAIVSTIVAMAKNLNLDVIAEGVETREQFQRLDQMGCESYQGYHFGRPMPPSEFSEICKKNQGQEEKYNAQDRIIKLVPDKYDF